MGSSAQPPAPASAPGTGHRGGRPCLQSRRAPPSSLSGKTNPSEPIEVKPLPFRQMLQILRKRTHKSYPPCFQSVAAKPSLIFGNSAPSRTRIEAANSASGRNVLRPFPPVFGSWEGAKASMPQDDPGMSFKIRGEGGGDAPAHQDLGNPSGSFEGSWQVGRQWASPLALGGGSDFSAADGRLGPTSSSKTGIFLGFMGIGEEGYVRHEDWRPQAALNPR